MDNTPEVEDEKADEQKVEVELTEQEKLVLDHVMQELFRDCLGSGSVIQDAVN
jgi:hypothetical protein